MRKQLSVLLLNLLACGTVLHAQQFHWEAPVNAIDSSGYTRILLQPHITSGMHDPFTDVRIYDNDSTEIPFLGVYDRVEKPTQHFVEYPVVDKNENVGHSWITVENPLHKTDPLDHLVMEVNNTQVKREMTLTGSYDGKQWYAIKDEFYFSFHERYDNGSTTTTTLVQFDFPKTDYRYFRFNFNNWTDWWFGYNAPVFVVRAGVLATTKTSLKNNWLEVPAPMITQTENKATRTSEVDIVFAEPHFIDHIRFDISPTNPNGKFFRGARLYLIKEDSIKGKLVRSEQLLSSAVLSAEAINEMTVGGKVKHLLLRIANEDDQPVHVNAAKGIQVKHYLLAFLQKDKNYVLRFGNDTVNAPRYDLRYLQDTLTAYELPVVTTGERKAITSITNAVVEEYSIWKDRRLIWGAFAIVVAILAWMSVKMLREMKGSSQ